MATCADFVHVEACHEFVKGLAAARGFKLGSVEEISAILQSDDCEQFKDCARFVELHHAEWVEDEDVCGVPIFRCSNCDEIFVLEEGTPFDNCYFYCPYCGAKMDEQALKKERQSNGQSEN